VGPRGEASVVSHPNACTVGVAIAPTMPAKDGGVPLSNQPVDTKAGFSSQVCSEPRQISRCWASGKGIGVFQAINPLLARRTSSRRA
jgi:hypothetical protein